MGIAYPPQRRSKSPAGRLPDPACRYPTTYGADVEDKDHPPGCVVRVRFTGPLGSRKNPRFWWSRRPCDCTRRVVPGACTARVGPRSDFSPAAGGGCARVRHGEEGRDNAVLAAENTAWQGRMERVGFHVDLLSRVEPEGACVSLIYFI